MSNDPQKQRYEFQNQQEEKIKRISGMISKYKSLKELPGEELVSIASEMGKILKDIGLKTTQIRKFLDSVRKIDIYSKNGDEFNKDQVILLRPKLAYAAGRQPKQIKPLMQVLEPAINAGSESYESFKKLLSLIESIIAYHKFYGGGD